MDFLRVRAIALAVLYTVSPEACVICHVQVMCNVANRYHMSIPKHAVVARANRAVTLEGG